MNGQYGERVSDSETSHCYRHPDRESFVLCQRCAKTICGECQQQAPVGVICPDCANLARSSAPRTRSSLGSRVTSETPIVTYVIMGVCALVFAAQWLTQSVAGLPSVTSALMYAPLYSFPQLFEPWRMLTTTFTHSPTSFLHILLNMYTLWLFGRQLELYLGRGRYIALYLISGFAGSVAVQFWAYVEPQSVFTPVVGASGAIFGLMGAFLIIGRHLGGNMTMLIVLLAINLGIGFLPGGAISWQAHIGGLIAGGAVAFILMRTRAQRQLRMQRRLVALVALLLVLMSFAYFAVPPVALQM